MISPEENETSQPFWNRSCCKIKTSLIGTDLSADSIKVMDFTTAGDFYVIWDLGGGVFWVASIVQQ